MINVLLFLIGLFVVIAVGIMTYRLVYDNETYPDESIVIQWDRNSIPMVVMQVKESQSNNKMSQIPVVFDTGSSSILLSSCECITCEEKACVPITVENAKLKKSYATQTDTTGVVNCDIALGSTLVEGITVDISMERNRSVLREYASHYSILGMDRNSSLLNRMKGIDWVSINMRNKNHSYVELLPSLTYAEIQHRSKCDSFAKFSMTKESTGLIESKCMVRCDGQEINCTVIFDIGSNYNFTNGDLYKHINGKKLNISQGTESFQMSKAKALHSEAIGTDCLLIGTLALKDCMLAFSPSRNLVVLCR